MARAHLRHKVTDRAGSAVQNALVYVYVTGTVTAVGDMYAASSGGSPITTLTSNAQGEVEAYFDIPKSVDLKVTDNTDAAYYPSDPATLLSFSDFTETVEVLPAADELGSKGVVGSYALADDTSGFQAWLSGLAANSFHEVRRPATSYKISGTLTMPTGGGSGVGYTIGWDNVLLKSTVGSGPVIDMNESVAFTGRLLIDCQDTAGSIGVRFGKGTVAVRNASIERLGVFNADGPGVHFYSASDFGVYYNHIGYLECRYGDDEGVLFESATATNQCNANYIGYASIQNNASHAVSINGADGNGFGYLEAETNTGYGIYLADCVGFYVAAGWLEGNTGGGAGGEIYIADYPTVKGVIDINTQSDGTFAAAISHTFSADRTVIIGRGNESTRSLGGYGAAALGIGDLGVAAADQNLYGNRLGVSTGLVAYRRSAADPWTYWRAVGTGNRGLRVSDVSDNNLAGFDTTIADTETALLLRCNDGGVFTLQRVTMGADDSGGAGYRVLRVPN